MWKKAFLRTTLVIGVVAAGVLFAAGVQNKGVSATEECQGANENECSTRVSSQNDFIIWESLSRTVLSAIQF